MEKWEAEFNQDLNSVDISKRLQAGVLLSIIPDQERWNEFLSKVTDYWKFWREDLNKFPKSLIVLYDGLAFYEYNDNTFWPQFSRAIGAKERISSNLQNEINIAFLKAVETLGLSIQRRDNGISYVGSAIYHIGIPLNLWDDFLEICEWALWQPAWNSLTDNEWNDSIERLLGGRQRLKKFLVENRETASIFIREMIDARRKLTEDPDLVLEDATQIIKFRKEYFDNVPETAEFLRPFSPDSLIRDYAGLVWNEDLGRISLQLPAVPKEKLPAIWIIGSGQSQEASASPDEFRLNSLAFSSALVLQLKSNKKSETQQLPGIEPWGLFDQDRHVFIKTKRKYFPIRAYTLISRNILENISREGFEDKENSANEEYELEDNTNCFITSLWPIGKSAKVSFTCKGIENRLQFTPNAKIETRLFIGPGGRSANFRIYSKEGDRIIIERTPLPCIAIPFGYLQSTQETLQCKFNIYIDDTRVDGRWEKGYEDDDREFYYWRRSSEFNFFSFLGKRIISISAPEFGLKFNYKIQIEKPKPKMDKCWKKLPGSFLLWFLLCQPSSILGRSGMKWEDILLARAAIYPKGKISYYLLRQYEDQGLLKQRGGYWMIAESRASLNSIGTGKCILDFCGNPSIIWGLFRYIFDRVKETKLPIVEVVDERGKGPYLQICWDENQEADINKYLKLHQVKIVSDIWK